MGGIFMKSNEAFVQPQSDIFFHTPSIQGQKMFFYPLCLGYYSYEQNYHLTRNSFDSFLLMYITSGECTVVTSGKMHNAASGQLVFIDCYQAHEYFSSKGWNCFWIHFDGVLAREYYNVITAQSGPVINLPRPQFIEGDIKKILNIFTENQIVKEALISGLLSSILTELLVSMSESNAVTGNSNIIDKITAYINEHPGEDLSLARLASLANLSPFYFARTFKKETGKTPHEYVMSSRINSAKFYLKTSRASIEEIGLSLGFPTSSYFCSSFRKHLGISPLKYRNAPSE
jgi:AraC-type DNA-binding domain-containing proteins